MGDTLFDTIARMHGSRPWGSVLDAGTGTHSLQWVLGLDTDRWVAVTGGASRRTLLERKLGHRMRPQDEVIVGNWTDPTLLHEERFDVVLADYLLGAIAGFAPYFQTQLFARLRPLVRGELYVVGLDPYPQKPSSEGGQIIQEIARLRDACILLAGHRCYREYPLEWVVRSLETSGFVVEDALRVDIVYNERFVNGQLDVCLRKLPLLRDPGLAAEMKRHIEALRERALPLAAQGIRFGSDYVVKATAS